jgi:hypothetical protein
MIINIEEFFSLTVSVWLRNYMRQTRVEKRKFVYPTKQQAEDRKNAWLAEQILDGWSVWSISEL